MSQFYLAAKKLIDSWKQDSSTPVSELLDKPLPCTRLSNIDAIVLFTLSIAYRRYRISRLDLFEMCIDQLFGPKPEDIPLSEQVDAVAYIYRTYGIEYGNETFVDILYDERTREYRKNIPVMIDMFNMFQDVYVMNDTLPVEEVINAVRSRLNLMT